MATRTKKSAAEAASAPAEVGLVPLSEQLTEKEQKAAKKSEPSGKALLADQAALAATIEANSKPAEPVAVVAGEPVSDVDEKRAAMLATLAKAREVRKQQLAAGIVEKPKPQSKPKPQAAPQSVPPGTLDQLTQLVAQMDLMLSRLTDALERLEKVPAA